MKVYNGIGPVIINKMKNLENNPNSITEKFHLLAIDFPCGVGFIRDKYFKCPELPKDKDGVTGWNELAITVAEGIIDFLNYRDSEGCDLANLKELPLYFWAEGFSSNLPLYIRKNIVQKSNIKISGIILGDPIIDLLRQNQNFASFSVSRRIDTNDGYREYLKLETNLQLIPKKEINNLVFCEFYSNLFKRFDTKTICPYDVLNPCPLLSLLLSSENCQIFVYDPIEMDIDNPITKIMIENMKLAGYQQKTIDMLYNTQSGINIQIFEDDAVTTLAEAVDNTKVLIFQSQNNFVANSISLMLFADTLRWNGYDKFISVRTQSIIVNPSDMQARFSLRSYGNYFKAQTYRTGGIDIYKNNNIILRDYLFDIFVRASVN